MSKKNKIKKNSKLGNKVALAIFINAVPALIERWQRYKEENSSDVTFDVFLTDLVEEGKKTN